MRYRHASAALAALLAGVIGASAPAPAQAADVFVHGRIGDVFVGIDTRDHFGRFDRHRHRRHGHRHVDPFDPRVDREQFIERLDRRFTYEKLFNGGTAFSHDRRRRALEGWPPPRSFEPHHDHHRHERFLPGILLPKGHYLYEEQSYREDGLRLDPEAAPPGDDLKSPEPVVVTPQPPDPRGPLREATGAAGAPPAIGQRLPRGRPHVALDWQDYDLPRPPAGHGYVRFEGSVLLIENGTRVVREVL